MPLFVRYPITLCIIEKEKKILQLQYPIQCQLYSVIRDVKVLEKQHFRINEHCDKDPAPSD